MAERVVSAIILLLLSQATTAAAATLTQPCASVNQLPEPLWLSFTEVLSFLQQVRWSSWRERESDARSHTPGMQGRACDRR